VFFITWTFRNLERGTVVPVPHEPPVVIPAERKTRELALGVGLVLVGITGLAGGGHFIVDAATRMALGFGVSETLIGLTLVAIGTSLPELATTVVAAVRNEDDLALGNIVGSNLFNILAVAGPVGVFWELKVEGPQNPLADLWLHPTPNQLQLFSMVALALMVAVMILLGKGRIGRRRGLILLVVYVLIMMIWTTS
jgi:cation:H+ antiporter